MLKPPRFPSMPQPAALPEATLTAAAEASEGRRMAGRWFDRACGWGIVAMADAGREADMERGARRGREGAGAHPVDEEPMLVGCTAGWVVARTVPETGSMRTRSSEPSALAGGG